MCTEKPKNHLKVAIKLRDDIQKITNPTKAKELDLWESVEMIRQVFNWAAFEVRERPSKSLRMLSERLSVIENLGRDKCNSAFVTNKKKLLAIMDRYLKEAEKGLL